jgi:hypothetical protein
MTLVPEISKNHFFREGLGFTVSIKTKIDYTIMENMILVQQKAFILAKDHL